MKNLIIKNLKKINKYTFNFNIFDNNNNNNNANLTSLFNIIKLIQNNYWYFNQSKFVLAILRLFTLGLLTLVISIFYGISGEFFLFLLVFEFIYSNIIKIFNYTVKVYLNDFIISYNNENLLFKIIAKNLKEARNYFKNLINEFNYLIINQNKKINLKKNYLKNSFLNYGILNKKGVNLITLKGTINSNFSMMVPQEYPPIINAVLLPFIYIEHFATKVESKMNYITSYISNIKEEYEEELINIWEENSKKIEKIVETGVKKFEKTSKKLIKKSISKIMSIEFSNNIKVEWGWIAAPSLMIVEIVTHSTDLIYYEDKPNVKTNMTILAWAKANQWYWSYQYENVSKFISEEVKIRISESYIVVADLLTQGEARLLIAMSEYVQPAVFNIKVLLTAIDVIHSFALAQVGSKIDALPGKLNQIFVNFVQIGAYLGQCSELCGFSHGFMPITKGVSIAKSFVNFVTVGFGGLNVNMNLGVEKLEVKKEGEVAKVEDKNQLDKAINDDDALMEYRFFKNNYYINKIRKQKWFKAIADWYNDKFYDPTLFFLGFFMIFLHWNVYCAQMHAYVDAHDSGYALGYNSGHATGYGVGVRDGSRAQVVEPIEYEYFE